MKITKTCIFCKKSPPDVTMTKEHLFPKWMKEKIPYEKSIIFSGNYREDIFSPGNKYELREMDGLSPFDMAVAAVCNQCNNGWMSCELEEPIQSILIDLTHGFTRELTNDDIKLLIRWSIKTAIIRAKIEKGLFGIPEEHIRSVFENRPLESVNVWIGCYPPDTECFTRFQRVVDENGYKAYTASFRINSLFIQIIGCEDYSLEDIYDKSFFTQREDSIGFMVNITALEKHQKIAWPLKEKIRINHHLLSGLIGHTYFNLPLNHEVNEI